MTGHVNMMDDVLIAQLPPVILRSALRALLRQGKGSQAILVDHVQKTLRASPPAFMSHTELFNGKPPSHPRFLAAVRCMFTSKMAFESLPYFSHFLACIPQAHLHWASDSELEATLTRVCADVVQAVQALKETHPPRTEELRNTLLNLQRVLISCQIYSEENNLPCPFARARLQVDDALCWFFPDTTYIRQVPNMIHSQPLDWSNLSTDTTDLISIEHTSLGFLEIPRLFNGLWQLSSPAWGSAPSWKQSAALEQLVKVGLLATDMADHYGDAELIYGAFRARLPSAVSNRVIAATKWCIFRRPEVEISSDFVLDAVRERSRRVGGRIQLLQFHWYDYSDKDYLRILTDLVRITKLHPELVSNIGLCNFDSEHTEEACLYILSELGEVGLVSNQVQYSLVDSRPFIKLTDVCIKYGLKILTYGSLCGGLFSQKWLGADAPDVYSESLQLTPSQRKYFDMITTWASWADFQDLLLTLKSIADKYHVELANVATRWVLDRPAVGAVIVGTRLGVSNNVQSNVKVFSLKLDEDDRKRLDAIALTRADKVYESIGDCGHEYQH